MKNTLQTRPGSVGSVVPVLGLLAMVGLLGIGCSDSSLKAQGSGGAAAGGNGGAASSGGAMGGGTGDLGGAAGANLGGAGGKGGSNAGGMPSGGAGGAGGTKCPPIQCGVLDCPNGTMPNPSNPCGCAMCAPGDAGPAKDASPDLCLALPCDHTACPPGTVAVERPCACPICLSPDAGPTDAPICPRTCPAVRCSTGTVRDACGCDTCIIPDGGPEASTGSDAAKDASVDVCLALPCALPSCAVGYTIVTHACGCPTCEPVDAGTDTGKLACVGLDECACTANDSCSVVSDACYCPFPQCGSGSCICGGGKFVGCAPAALNSCAAAKSRLASLCPTLQGPTFDGLCQQTDTACVTKCLNDVTSCGEVGCTFCVDCNCAADPFMRCVSTCRNALKQ